LSAEFSVKLSRVKEAQSNSLSLSMRMAKSHKAVYIKILRNDLFETFTIQIDLKSLPTRVVNGY